MRWERGERTLVMNWPEVSPEEEKAEDPAQLGEFEHDGIAGVEVEPRRQSSWLLLPSIGPLGLTSSGIMPQTVHSVEYSRAGRELQRIGSRRTRIAASLTDTMAPA
jgi:hypothetical protein